MSTHDVTATLRVSGADGAWVAAIVFSNVGDERAMLYKPNLFEDGLIQNNVFVITVDDRKAPYRGIYMKRPEPRPEDFLILEPASSVGYLVNLDAAYVILPQAQGRRRIVYDAFHGSATLEGGLWRLQSNEVIF